jgi:hypothetical protein
MIIGMIKGHPMLNRMLNRMQGKQRQGLSGQLNAQGGVRRGFALTG